MEKIEENIVIIKPEEIDGEEELVKIFMKINPDNPFDDIDEFSQYIDRDFNCDYYDYTFLYNLSKDELEKITKSLMEKEICFLHEFDFLFYIAKTHGFHKEKLPSLIEKHYGNGIYDRGEEKISITNIMYMISEILTICDVPSLKKFYEKWNKIPIDEIASDISQGFISFEEELFESV